MPEKNINPRPIEITWPKPVGCTKKFTSRYIELNETINSHPKCPSKTRKWQKASNC